VSLPGLRPANRPTPAAQGEGGPGGQLFPLDTYFLAVAAIAAGMWTWWPPFLMEPKYPVPVLSRNVPVRTPFRSVISPCETVGSV